MPGRRRFWESRPHNEPASANAFERRSSFDSADAYLYSLRTRQRRRIERPEHALLTTVIGDGLRILTDHYEYRKESAGLGKIWQETWDWFWSDEETAWVLSAQEVCAHLDIDIERLRVALVTRIEEINAATTDRGGLRVVPTRKPS